MRNFGLAGAALLLAASSPAQTVDLPAAVLHQLPPGYDVMSVGAATFAGPARTNYMVVLSKRGEIPSAHSAGPAPARPLLLFAQRPGGDYVQTGRNDHVVLRADEGGQCDPFEDGGGVAVKGRFFTVQNGVACGQHWTDYVTFRFDDALGDYVFDNERLESSSFNPSTDPDAEALIPDAPVVRRARPGRPVRFENWRPSRP